MQKTCIVVPCFNEEKRLDISAFVKFLEEKPLDFIFVNDGSKDATRKILLDLQSKFPQNVFILNLKKNIGKAEAVRSGFLKAISDDCYSVIGYIDADLATPLEELHYLLNHLTGDFEIVIGSRVKRLGVNIKRNITRHYLGRVFATYSSYILKIKVYDSQCGAKLFHNQIANEIFIKPFSSKWLFDLEILYRFKIMKQDNFNKNILEVPLRKWEEKPNSKMKAIDFMKAPLDVFRIKNEN